MIAISCANCNRPVSTQGDRLPPWCPHCGASIKAGSSSPKVVDRYSASDGAAGRHSSFSASSSGAVNATSVPGDSRHPAPKVTVWAKCFKRFTCAACGCVYRIEHSAAGEGSLEETARQKAEANLCQRMENQADGPCPTCGMVRPDLVAERKFWGHGAILLLSGSVLLCLIFLAAPQAPADYAGIAGAVVVGLAGLAHLLFLLYRPRRISPTEKEPVAPGAAEGNVEVLKPGSVDDLRDPGHLSLGHGLALLGLLFAPVVLLVPSYLRTSNDWPINPKLAPYVIGPGDTVLVHFRDPKLRSLNGLWQGDPQARLQNAAEVAGPAVLLASSQKAAWGKKISVEEAPHLTKDAPLKNLFAFLHIPDDPALASKTLQVQVNMLVTYPVGKDASHWIQMTKGNKGTFEHRTTTVSTEVAIQLTPAGGGHAYRTAWTVAAALGGLSYVAGAVVLLLLASIHSSRAKPVELVPVETN